MGQQGRGRNAGLDKNLTDRPYIDAGCVLYLIYMVVCASAYVGLIGTIFMLQILGRRDFVYYAFELSALRKIAEANYNTFVNPSLHPNRVMQQHDFLYILDGEWEIALEDNKGQRESYRIQKDDLLILPAQFHHYGTKLCSPNLRSMYIHAETLLEDHPTNAEKTNAAGQDFVVLPTVLHCGGRIEISRYFSDIIAVCWGDTVYRAQRLSSLFELLLCALGELETAVPQNLQCMAFVNEIARFLRSNPELFFSVSEIAQKFNVSEKTLNKRFKIVYQKPFYTWQMEQKLDMVYQSLHHNADITLKEMAVNYGFYDEFHLSRAFKKKFGVAPRYIC